MPVADIGTQTYKARVFKPNPYTSQPCALERVQLEDEYYSTGYEDRPGMMDLRPLVFERDKHVCQMCGNAVTYHTAEIDHIKPVRRFKRPIEALIPKRPAPKEVVRKLTQIRKNLGLSQTGIVKPLKHKSSPLRASQISNFEQGKREPPLMLLLAYARLAGISTDVLIDDNLDIVKGH